MSTADFLFLDGKAHRVNELLISPNNRSFRYGDGFFETMKWVDGRIMLENYHFERLFESLAKLHFEWPNYFTKSYLSQQIKELVQKNGHGKLARIRVTIFRGEGGLHDYLNHYPHHLIQTWALNPANNEMNENGMVVDVYKDARKVCDGFSQVKSNNYLHYAMASIWAKQNHLNEAILCNPYDRIADATIANIFLIKDGLIKTPALSEGPVAGVMRRHLLTCLRNDHLPVEEAAITLEELNQASEIFLTNAIYGIRWIKQLGKNQFSNQMGAFLYKKYLKLNKF